MAPNREILRKQSLERWLEEIDSRQRNVVFPETLRNETAGWRRLMESGKPLTFEQVLGFALMLATVGAVWWHSIKDKLHASEGSGSFPERFWSAFGDWILLFSLAAIVFLALRWSVKRALRTSTKIREKKNQPPLL